jgi:hypothetical protein
MEMMNFALWKAAKKAGGNARRPIHSSGDFIIAFGFTDKSSLPPNNLFLFPFYSSSYVHWSHFASFSCLDFSLLIHPGAQSPVGQVKWFFSLPFGVSIYFLKPLDQIMIPHKFGVSNPSKPF